MSSTLSRYVEALGMSHIRVIDLTRAPSRDGSSTITASSVTKDDCIDLHAEMGVLAAASAYPAATAHEQRPQQPARHQVFAS